MEKFLKNDKLILRPEKDLTVNIVRELIDKTKEFINNEKNYNEVILDIGQVKIIDSTGISFLIGLYKSAVGLGRGFKIEGANSEIQKLFKLMKLDDIFRI